MTNRRIIFSVSKVVYQTGRMIYMKKKGSGVNLLLVASKQAVYVFKAETSYELELASLTRTREWLGWLVVCRGGFVSVIKRTRELVSGIPSRFYFCTSEARFVEKRPFTMCIEPFRIERIVRNWVPTFPVHRSRFQLVIVFPSALDK